MWEDDDDDDDEDEEDEEGEEDEKNEEDEGLIAVPKWNDKLLVSFGAGVRRIIRLAHFIQHNYRNQGLTSSIRSGEQGHRGC